MKIRCTLCVLAIMAVTVAHAQLPENKMDINLPEMFREVDEAIEESPKFVKNYRNNIEEVKHSFLEAESDNQRMMLLMQICKLYESFNGDSALAYSFRCVDMARNLGLTEVEADYQALSAYLCTFLGSQTEALELLKRIDKSKLSNEGLGTYYRAYLSSYETLADNCKTPELGKSFRRLHLQYLDSLLHATPEGSDLYYFYYEDQLIKKGKLKQALKMNDKRLDMYGHGSRQDAIIAYARYRIYEKNGNKDLATYWLCRSALADIRNAVMDQLSLITLAQKLEDEGDYERAGRYISFTWESNRQYSPHMRAWQITPLLSAIESNYQAKLNQKTHWFQYTAAAAGILFLLLIVQMLRVRRLKKKVKKEEDTDD